MILSISRRTDVPAFYMTWFLKRQAAGYVLTRNPMNSKQISRIHFKDVNCYVFWTKNPKALVEHLNLIEKPFITQVTLTPYTRDLEECVLNKQEIIKNTIILSQRTNKGCVNWRYDPIILSERYTKAYHIKYFEKLCQAFSGHITSCTISFVDMYKKIRQPLSHIKEPTLEEKLDLVSAFQRIAEIYHIQIQSCCESLGISQGACIDKKIIQMLGFEGYKYDRYQREGCGCLESVDIGAYNTCIHRCLYCYANYHHYKAEEFHLWFDDESEILGTPLIGDETIRDKVIKRNHQISLF